MHNNTNNDNNNDNNYNNYYNNMISYCDNIIMKAKA